MSLHGLLSVTIGVPNVEETAAYYAEFGLTPGADGWFTRADPVRPRKLGHAVVGSTDYRATTAFFTGDRHRRPRSCTPRTSPP